MHEEHQFYASSKFIKSKYTVVKPLHYISGRLEITFGVWSASCKRKAKKKQATCIQNKIKIYKSINILRNQS